MPIGYYCKATTMNGTKPKKEQILVTSIEHVPNKGKLSTSHNPQATCKGRTSLPLACQGLNPCHLRNDCSVTPI